MARSSWAAQVHRNEREAARRRKELVAYSRAQAVWQEHQRAQYEVNVFENQIEFLNSMHKDCGETWDWRHLAVRQLPPPPSEGHAYEEAARRVAADYAPSFLEKTFGGATKRRAQLQQSVEQARQQDVQLFQAAQAEHAGQVEMSNWERATAAGIIAGDLAAYHTVIEHLSPFAELVESGMTVSIDALQLDVAVVRCVVADNSVVPSEEKKLTASGKLGTKKIAAGTYWSLYQDYVCGCALRVVREMFALLPLPRIIVNVAISGVDSSTGRHGQVIILTMSVPREVATGLRYATLDPSDSLKNFPHRIKFKKTSGFEAVEPMSVSEAFITSATR